MTRCQQQKGFTLIELIIFIVVIGVGVAGVLSVFTSSVRNSVDPLVRKQTQAIAESLLEEIVLKEFQDPNGGTNGVSTCNLAVGVNRTVWDDVCDYNGYTSAAITDAEGNVVPGLAAYRVTSVGVSTVQLTGGGAPNVKRIVVSVTGPQGVVSLIGYRGKY